MSKKKYNGSDTDHIDKSNMLDLIINVLVDNTISDHKPCHIADRLKDSNYHDINFSAASFANKYHNFFWHENPNEERDENWQMMLNIFQDYCDLRKKSKSEKKLEKEDFDNFLTNENLSFLHYMLSSYLSNPNLIETGVDDFEITMRMPDHFHDKIVQQLHGLNRKSKKCKACKGKEYCELCINVIEKDHYSNKGYQQRYHHATKFIFRSGGTFVFYRRKGKCMGDCLISFRLSETPWENIQAFFDCMYKALGEFFYQVFVDHARITRKDPYLLFKGIPQQLLLVDTHSTKNGNPIKKEVMNGIADNIHGSSYLGDRSSSHTIIYCMYAKFLQLKNKFLKGKTTSKEKRKQYRKLFKEADSIHCITKIERRLDAHQQGSKNLGVEDLHLVRGHTFNKLEFYSPLVFKDLSYSITQKIFKHGLVCVRKHLTTKQIEALDTTLNKPNNQIYFDYKAVVSTIELKLKKLQRIIKYPNSRMRNRHPNLVTNRLIKKKRKKKLTRKG